MERTKAALEQAKWIKSYNRPSVAEGGIYSMTLGFCHRRFKTGIQLTKATELNLPLFDQLRALIREARPDFGYTTIVVNRNLRCKKHRDTMNQGLSYIVGLGDYTGGELTYYEPKGAKEGERVDLRERWFCFDGHNEHETMPFEGDRYTVVYFTHKKIRREHLDRYLLNKRSE